MPLYWQRHLVKGTLGDLGVKLASQEAPRLPSKPTLLMIQMNLLLGPLKGPKGPMESVLATAARQKDLHRVFS